MGYGGFSTLDIAIATPSDLIGVAGVEPASAA